MRRLLFAVCLAACAAEDDPNALRRRPPGEYDPAKDPVADAPIPEGTEIGKAQVRRLTAAEYEATVREAFGFDDAWSAGLSADRATEKGFDNDALLLEVDESKTGELVTAAESIADKVKLPCTSETRACASTIIETSGRKLFRHVLSAEEKTRYEGIFDQIVQRGASPREGIKWTLVALLSSPSFLYRTELGKDAGNGKHVLEGEEIASELSYTFGGLPPDDALLERGRRGELTSAEARVAEAKRLLATPRGHKVLERFTQQWLRYDDVRTIAKDEATVPGFATLRGEMADETRKFLDDIVFEKKGGVRELFTSRSTFGTSALATHYGHPQNQAIGILGQGSILSRYALTQASSPPQRGAFVRRKLLCQALPPPPPNAGEPPVPAPGVTTRELYEKGHSASQPACKSCHAVIDPIGFGLEHFDVAGRYRTTERGKPINATGQIAAFEDNPSFNDHVALAGVLGKSRKVADCIGGLMAIYAFGAEHGDRYTLASAREELASKLPLVDYYAQIAAGPHFAVRWKP